MVVTSSNRDPILNAIHETTPLAFETVLALYEITKSYDAILEIFNISAKYHVDILELASCLYRQ